MLQFAATRRMRVDNRSHYHPPIQLIYRTAGNVQALGPDVHSTPADLRGHLSQATGRAADRVGCLVPSASARPAAPVSTSLVVGNSDRLSRPGSKLRGDLPGPADSVSRSDHERGHPRPVASPAKLLTKVAPLSRSTTTFANSKIAVQRLGNVAGVRAATCRGRSLL